jgi:radical SAM PhpK family P-methyltransferase
MNFPGYEERIRQMGENTVTYRDLNLNFIRYNNVPYHPAEVFNLFCVDHQSAAGKGKFLNMLDTISTTIAYLGSYLHKNGFSFDYVNSFQDEKEKLKRLLTTDGDRILAVAITTTLYLSALPIIEIVDFIRTYSPSVKIIIGGPFISTQVRWLDQGQLQFLFTSTLKADFYVNSSQGEATLVKLLHALKNHMPVENIPNIYYKVPGGYAATPTVAENNRLSENMVDWSLFADRVTELLNIRTAISCPFSCAFCRYPGHAGAYQTMDVQAIEQELNTLSRISALKSIYFIDDTFNVPPKRFKEILKMMVKNDYKFRWHSYFRCQFADAEMLELMKESGCEGVYLGLESGNDQILKNMNKAVTVDDYRRGIEIIKKFDLVTFGSLIIGFPGETEETVRDTVDFLADIQLDFFRAHPWYYEPVAPVWKQRDKYDIKGESYEWSHRTMDANTAADIVDQVFLSFDKSIWVPQYNFNFDNIWHLIHKGVGMDTVKAFLKNFNNAIKQRLLNPARHNEISYDIVKQLTGLCRAANHSPDSSGEKQQINRADADFDFS